MRTVFGLALMGDSELPILEISGFGLTPSIKDLEHHLLPVFGSESSAL
jgi:hypothetical protein